MRSYPYTRLLCLVTVTIYSHLPAANIVIYDPPIIIENGNVTDPRAKGWANAYQALSNPRIFDSFEEWRSYLGGSLANQATQQHYDLNVDFTSSAVESVLYAVEHEEDGKVYLFLGSISGRAMSEIPRRGDFSSLAGSLTALQWEHNRWVAVHGMDIEPMQRPFHAIYQDDIDQWLESGRVTQTDRLQHSEVPQPSSENHDLAVLDQNVTESPAPSGKLETRSNSASDKGRSSSNKRPDPNEQVQNVGEVQSKSYTALIVASGIALLIIAALSVFIKTRSK